jgi:uncharacterized PurR-regulated membrane protein YhhQ (DUF165 family)
MSSFSTIVLVPFIFAFLVFVVRFYGRESASSMRNPSFMLALVTMLAAGGYLLLRITDTLPSYGTIGFGLAGLVLLAIAIGRMFMI